MDYFNAFWVGGLICALVQILLDKTKLMPGRVMVLLVCTGAILGAVGIYQPLIDFAGAGASVPLLGFGNTLWKGLKKAIDQDGFIGLFTGGFGLHSGAERLGATVIPMSSGNTSLQIQTMIDFGATVLCCTPSYAMYLGETVENMGLKDQLKLKVGIFGAEPWSEEMRRQIEEKLGIKAYDIYGLSETMGPGVACECECQKGMHVLEDNFIPEIIDPETGEVLPEGSVGELVFTTLTKEAFPVIRYRTRDICSLIYDPCACGRTHVRMKKPNGRSDDMLIIRGVNVFPSQIEEVLLKTSGGKITPNYQIIVDRVNNTDTFEVNVEMSDELFSDDIRTIENTEKKITDSLRSVLGIGARVRLVNPKSIERSEGKAKRVIDRRKI